LILLRKIKENAAQKKSFAAEGGKNL